VENSSRLLYDEPFVAVFPSLVRLLDGDVAAAAVLQHINFRSNSRQAIRTQDGHYWYPVTREDLADEIGLSLKQVKRIIDKLRARGVLLIEQMGGIDRRNFYRIDLKWADPLDPNGTDGTTPYGPDGRAPDGTDVPYIKEPKEKKDKRTLVRKPVDDHDPRFEEFWATYPRKSAKGAARRAWARAAAATDPNLIIAGAARYAADPNREDTYTAHPATWLNGERWLDDALPARASRGDRKTNEVAEMIRRASMRDERKEIEG
jgi:biotin operon repressor